jgi:hypothetical protein
MLVSNQAIFYLTPVRFTSQTNKHSWRAHAQKPAQQKPQLSKLLSVFCSYGWDELGEEEDSSERGHLAVWGVVF